MWQSRDMINSTRNSQPEESKARICSHPPTARRVWHSRLDDAASPRCEYIEPPRTGAAQLMGGKCLSSRTSVIRLPTERANDAACWCFEGNGTATLAAHARLGEVS